VSFIVLILCEKSLIFILGEIVFQIFVDLLTKFSDGWALIMRVGFLSDSVYCS
jgi:hypothetical protein